MTTNKTVFDSMTEQFINDRLDYLMMQNPEYIKLQEELWMEKERVDKLNLSKTQCFVVEKLISLHIKMAGLYGKKAYGQGFKDCVSMLQEIGVIRKD